VEVLPRLELEPRSAAAKTSTTRASACSNKRCPPQRAHHLRVARGVFANVATCSAPLATLTASALQRANELTGLADQRRHDSQWQYAISSGAPVATSSTAPQKHFPL